MKAILYAVAVVLTYLVGSIPFAYLAGRLIAGKDLGRTGTGNLGAHNVFHEVGRVSGVLVFFLDCAKIGITLLVFRLLGLPLMVQSLGALAVIAGHNWSVFTGFRGGRGMTVILVGSLILLPWESLAVVGVLGFGALTRTLAMYCGFSLVLWPVLAILRGEPTSLVVFALGAMVLGFARRLQGSPGVAPVHRRYVSIKDVLISRLILDREYQPAWVEETNSQ